MTAPASDPARTLLRHSVATLAYRAEKVLRDAPGSFPDLSIGPGSRTPLEILAHIGDLLDWARWLARGEHRWFPSPPRTWTGEVDRFFDALAAFDAELQGATPLGATPERLFQGPVADALTHVGQLAMLRRLAQSPVTGENYFKAEIEIGRIGPGQPDRRVEFE